MYPKSIQVSKKKICCCFVVLTRHHGSRTGERCLQVSISHTMFKCPPESATANPSSQPTMSSKATCLYTDEYFFVNQKIYFLLRLVRTWQADGLLSRIAVHVECSHRVGVSPTRFPTSVRVKGIYARTILKSQYTIWERREEYVESQNAASSRSSGQPLGQALERCTPSLACELRCHAWHGKCRARCGLTMWCVSLSLLQADNFKRNVFYLLSPVPISVHVWISKYTLV